MLAATRLIALHKNKGMTVAACLKNRTDYIENPDKTEQGQYVSSYACSALTADEEFMLTKRQYTSFKVWYDIPNTYFEKSSNCLSS